MGQPQSHRGTETKRKDVRSEITEETESKRMTKRNAPTTHKGTGPVLLATLAAGRPRYTLTTGQGDCLIMA